mmetsp:Transcript_22946/g.64454  ORF Transcript_22946/g.64454 Transcript_22946/m.64454 type:complete len:317 (-) Transcript_22946:460-1410(-)|eukprot:CAMPEP_0177203836 /NCGR_PEP_ID=MMETSP0367-20130122/28025_1 /TAXON_ID=447022 ORGANISM="Scrippsiella hangoei-like, Strain SHHI-4" /NCGR_SAMPLE_ID=MMETSP0367 /ASSEMBLY_ACC=CAM_ASM_000362 /LENGTH=316 /DNA_ID=CAMNT_0018652489 /DNA_START=107 /DNA_END=1057 /DNA_ORIENTATION=+
MVVAVLCALAALTLTAQCEASWTDGKPSGSKAFLGRTVETERALQAAVTERALQVSTVENLDFNPEAVDADFVLEVMERTARTGQGGTIQAGDSLSEKALLGSGMAFSLFTLEPGGENLPHYHPRATEFLYLIGGGPLEVGFTDTSGTLHMNTLKAGQATIFPRALIHFQRNLGKWKAQYISSLNNENPGVMSLPRTFYSLPDKALSNAMRESEEEIRGDKRRVLPKSLLLGNTDYDGVAGEDGSAPVSDFAPEHCPDACHKPECVDGFAPYEGWKWLVDGVCHYYCSRKIGEAHYCGDGPEFKSDDSVDCRSCKM